MANKNDLIKGVNDRFDGNYSISSGYVIPDVEDLVLGKTGRELELAMMFIDIRESTKIVDGFRRETAAKMYKSFLWGVAQIARNNGGELRSFNGDGVLIAFIGDLKCTNAAKAGLQMSWLCKKVLKPKLQAYFQNNEQLRNIDFDFGIGIDTGKVLVVRGGIRGDNNNDLVWVGNATNYAVKLSSIPDEGYHIFISEDIYKKMSESSKFGGDPKRNMWESRSWGGKTLYRSNWTWPPS
jgi:class 3 adenylate cyclase